jgi:CRP/FNR family transcriptional regulator, dissimilatory nitrate respiration regulator
VSNISVNPLGFNLWQALHQLECAPIEISHQPLFQRGQRSRGIYLVEAGEVKLLLSSKSGRAQKLEVAGPGTVLGLSETVSGGEHKLTAEASANARIFYIDRDSFLQSLSNDHQLCLQVVRLLSENLHLLYYCCRSLAFPDTRSDLHHPGNRN